MGLSPQITSQYASHLAFMTFWAENWVMSRQKHFRINYKWKLSSRSIRGNQETRFCEKIREFYSVYIVLFINEWYKVIGYNRVCSNYLVLFATGKAGGSSISPNPSKMKSPPLSSTIVSPSSTLTVHPRYYVRIYIYLWYAD